MQVKEGQGKKREKLKKEREEVGDGGVKVER